ELARVDASGQKRLSIRDVKRDLGVEVTVRSQDEMNSLVFDNYRQYVINIEADEEDLVINNASNVIITSGRELNKLAINNANNVMIKNISATQVAINNSRGVTVDSCRFRDSVQGILLSGSEDVMVRDSVVQLNQ
ncbi:MAG: hypothetical protein JXA66_00025, partial [Oligoflexia bacterium]|nr:hypothetical protein [Oligoflexia bacterium]